MPVPQALSRPPPALGGLLAQHFLSDEFPEPLRPTAGAHRLQVAVIWGGNQVVEVRDVAAGAPFTVGPRNSSLQLFHTLPVHGPVPLVQWMADGSAVILLPDAARPIIRARGSDRSLQNLLEEGGAERVDLPIRGARYVLGLHERVKLEFGSLQLVARFTRPETFRQRSFIERLDRRFLAAVGVISLMALVLVKLMLLTHPQEVSSDDVLKKLAEQIRVFQAVHPPPPPPAKGGHAAAAAGPRGRVGRPDVARPNAAPARPRAAVPNNQHERNHQVVANVGLVAALNNLRSTGDVFAPIGANNGLNKALGGVQANAPTADANGTGGLTARGDGSGGGGHSLNIGGIGEGPDGPGGSGGHRGREFRIARGSKPAVLPPSVDGVPDDSGYKDVIARIVKRHWNEIKYCYERDLNHNPNLEGKVAIHFEIGASGQVLTAGVRETTLGDASAEDCMVRAIQRLIFPAPKSNVVEVNYPFIFTVAQ